MSALIPYFNGTVSAFMFSALLQIQLGNKFGQIAAE